MRAAQASERPCATKFADTSHGDADRGGPAGVGSADERPDERDDGDGRGGERERRDAPDQLALRLSCSPPSPLPYRSQTM